MNRIKPAVRLESFGLPLRNAIRAAGKAGAVGVQFDPVGELAPKALSATGRRELAHLLKASELDLAALGCPLRHGLGTAENQQARIDHVRSVMDLSFDLGPRLVVVQAGHIPDEPDDPWRVRLVESVGELGRHGDRTGTTLALETGLETGAVLRAFLGGFDTGGLGAALDPANVLINRFDPYETARALHGKISLVHAHDARTASASRAAQEVALGHGDIDWIRFLGVLEEVEYRGWVVVERDEPSNPAEMTAAVAFLRKFVG